MFGDRLLPAGVGVNRLGVGSQLQGGKPEDLLVNLQRRLLEKSAEHSHEGDLVSETQPVVGALSLTRARYAALIVVSDPDGGASPVTRAIESADPRLTATRTRSRPGSSGCG